MYRLYIILTMGGAIPMVFIIQNSAYMMVAIVAKRRVILNQFTAVARKALATVPSDIFV